jgi:hypothetical protein
MPLPQDLQVTELGLVKDSPDDGTRKILFSRTAGDVLSAGRAGTRQFILAMR